MKQVSVSYHRDGDSVRVSEVPWWSPAYETVVSGLFCPCCGISGFLSRMEWYEVLTFRVWNFFLNYSHKKARELISVPVVSGCIASQALWGDHKFCWKDDCPIA